MPACRCGQWFVDGAALRTHLHERHPTAADPRVGRPEEVTEK